MNVLRAAASALGSIGHAGDGDRNNDTDIYSDTNADTDATTISSAGFDLDEIQKRLFDAKLKYTELLKSSENGFKTEAEYATFQRHLDQFKSEIIKYSRLCEKSMIKQQKLARLEKQKRKQQWHSESDALKSRPPPSTNTSFFDTSNIESFSEIERENEKAIQMLKNVVNLDKTDLFKSPRQPLHQKNTDSNYISNQTSHKVMTPSGKVWRVPTSINTTQPKPSKIPSLNKITSPNQFQEHIINLSTSSMEVMPPSIREDNSLQNSGIKAIPSTRPPPFNIPQFPDDSLNTRKLDKVNGLNMGISALDPSLNSSKSSTGKSDQKQDTDNNSNSLVLTLDDLDLESGFGAVKMGKLIQRFLKLSEEYRKLNSEHQKQNAQLEEFKEEISFLKDSNSRLKNNLVSKEDIIHDKDLIIKRNIEYLQNTPPKQTEAEEKLTGEPLVKREIQKLRDVSNVLQSPEVADHGFKIPLFIVYLLQHAADGVSMFLDGASAEKIAEKLGVGDFFKDTPNHDHFYLNEEDTDIEHANTFEASPTKNTNKRNRTNTQETFERNDQGHDSHTSIRTSNLTKSTNEHFNTPPSPKNVYTTPKPNTVKTRTHSYHISKQVSWKSPRQYQYFGGRSDDESDDETNTEPEEYEDVDANGNYLLDPSTNPNLIPISNSKLKLSASKYDNENRHSHTRRRKGRQRRRSSSSSCEASESIHFSDDSEYDNFADSRITSKEFAHFSPAQCITFFQYHLKKKNQRIQDFMFLTMVLHHEIDNYKQTIKTQRQLWEMIHRAVFGTSPQSSLPPSNTGTGLLLYQNYDSDMDSEQDLYYKRKEIRKRNRKYVKSVFLAVLSVVRIRMRCRKRKAEKARMVNMIKHI